YSVSENGVYQFNNTDIQVLKDSFINGHQYAAIADSSYRIYSGMRFLRQDGSTKNIYFYNSDSTMEYMEIPGEPAMGQTWKYFNLSKNVTNLSASIKTNYCNYSGLLEISDFDGVTLKAKRYYKKGLGLIYSVYPDGVNEGRVFSISKVRLK
ncbi:MAG: hypothetical protein H7321_09865, partial [Bacteroidia bacterium]|nr:hypothetical protein [Bacteroidia bacterium]